MKTPNDGAAQERTAFRRYIKRAAKKSFVLSPDNALRWLDARTARLAKRTGGLGKR